MGTLIRHHIVRYRLAGALLRPLGFSHNAITITDRGLLLHGDGVTELAFEDLVGPVGELETLGFAALSLPLVSGVIRIAGFGRRNASEFCTVLRTALAMHAARLNYASSLATAVDALKASRATLLQRMASDLGSATVNIKVASFSVAFASVETEIAELVMKIGQLRNTDRFLPASHIQPIWREVGRLLGRLPSPAGVGVLAPGQRDALDQMVRFHNDPESVRFPANNAFIASALPSFNNGPASRLTEEQRRAVLTDEDATLVLAGAGSGKTSVIVEKAAYLIERGLCYPHEILLVTFGNVAAKEIAERVRDRVDAEVEVRTFHALGYAIIKEVEDPVPTPAPHAADEKKFSALLRSILVNDIATYPGLARLLLKWFAEFHHPNRSEWDFGSMEEYRRYVDARELRTLQGDRVRSFEELEIANWLYLNGIPYEYEAIYQPRRVRGAFSSKTVYRPDFHLTGTDIYIEHFGLRESGHENGRRVYATAPGVNHRRYLRDIEWKRGVHRDHGTTLVETFSFEKVEGRLIEGLREKLFKLGVSPTPLTGKRIFEKLAELDEIDRFTPIITTFLRHFKSSGATIEDCMNRAGQIRQPNRAEAFLELFRPLYGAYQARLVDGAHVDFEDMILKATEHVTARRYGSPYRYLIVDEFQDIFRGSAELLKALKAQHADTRLFAVGDDWQSIYRFLGSDVGLMSGFGREFGGILAGQSGVHARVDLTNTFRCVDRIALPARDFILRNPAQLAKEVIPAGTVDEPAISVRYHRRDEEAETLASVLGEIDATRGGVSGDARASVLLLGRYNALKPDPMPEFKNLSIEFMSCHASKGLEADHVVILGVNAGGFPSMIQDDPLIDLVLPDTENYEFAEERRLFYVALSRARCTVTIIADRYKPSPFVLELDQ